MDSKFEILLHSRRVDEYLLQIVSKIHLRITKHDITKLEEPELTVFDVYSPKLKDTVYGSVEYKTYLNEMKVALRHHYQHNRHHPEHFDRGIDGMTLIDILEMFADWKAASERHEHGDFETSLLIQQDRFNMSDQLVDIFRNTADELGWINKSR